MQTAKTPEKGMSFQLIENTKVLCKDNKLIIPASLQHRAVSWYHHYLQHPGHLCLKEMMRFVMYWKGMQCTIQSYVESCKYCQVNKRHSQKYGHVPPKLVITTPWEVLCVSYVHTLLTAKMVQVLTVCALLLLIQQQVGSRW
jgi:hypothetical protein